MKTIHTFPLKKSAEINAFLAKYPFLPGTINFNAGSINNPPSVSFVLDHDSRADRERNALEDQLHNWVMKRDEGEITKTYWTQEQIKQAKNPNKEVHKTIEDNLRQATFNIDMANSNIHAIEAKITAIQNGE
jgi:hypothetical protein